MGNNSKRKVTVVFAVIAIFTLLFTFASCKSDALPKSNIEAKDAWDFVSAGFNKTSAAKSYKVIFETHSDAAFGEFSSTDRYLQMNISLCLISFIRWRKIVILFQCLACMFQIILMLLKR